MPRLAARRAAKAARIKAHIKKNDTVEVIAGKDKGKTARVLSVFPRRGTAIVEGVHFVKRHTKPNPSRNIKGGIAEKEGAINLSNVMIVCPECKTRTKVAFKVQEDGTRLRTCKKCNQIMDLKS